MPRFDWDEVKKKAERRGYIRSAQERLYESRYGSTARSTPNPYDTKQSRNFLRRSLRTVGEVLEPLQLPQDMLFGAIRGMVDPTTSITEQWKQLDYGAYFNPTVAATRYNSGEKLLSLFGAGKGLAKWGGLAADFLVDPLAMGTVLRATAKVAKAAGAVDDVAEITAFANKIDHAINPYRPLPPSLERKVVDYAADNIVKPILDMNFAGRTVRERASDLPIFGTRQQARIGLSDVEGAEDIVREISDARNLAEGRRDMVETVLTDNLNTLQEILNPTQQKRFFGNLMQSVGMQRNSLRKIETIPPVVRDKVVQELYDFSQESGIRFQGDVLQGMSDASNPILQEVSSELAHIFSPAAEKGRKMAAGSALEANKRIRQAQKSWDDRIGEIREIAKKNGTVPDVVEDMFTEASKKITESAAIAGYELSMLRPVKENIIETLVQASLAAPPSSRLANLTQDDYYEIFSNVMGQGMGGTKLEDIHTIALSNGLPMEVKKLFPGKNNMREVLDDHPMFQRLDLDVYFPSLQDGHLRRSLGAFQDARSFQDYTDLFEKGKLIASNFIDEKLILSDMQGAGFAEEGKAIMEYIAQITPMSKKGNRLNPSKARGMVLRQTQLFEHLVQQGFDPKRARAALYEMGKHANAPEYRNFLDKMQSMVEQYDSILPDVVPEIRNQGVGMLNRRKELDSEFLDILAEIADPLISLGETAKFTGASIPRQEFLASLWKISDKNGLMSTTRRGKAEADWLWTGSHTALGPFADKYVHPYIAKELNRALKTPEARPKILENIEALVARVSGGFLTGPNVLAANIGGGLLTSHQLGINPIIMADEMVRTTRDWVKMGGDPRKMFDDLAELRKYQNIEIGGMSREAQKFFQQDFADLQIAKLDNDPGYIRKVVNTLTNFYDKKMVQTTFGVLPGLQAFGTSESIMRVSAFRAAKRMGFEPAEAAEMARLSTFDYSELPELLKITKRYGLTLFPGFPYFLPGRIMGAALKNPYSLAMQDRLPDVITDAVVDDDDERLRLYASMPEWLRDERGVPIYTRPRGQGEQFGVIPSAQIIPTRARWGAPMVEGLATVGLWGAALETINAIRNGDGEAVFSRRYGRQVFEAGESRGTKVKQILGHIYNSYAPGGFRKLVSFNTQDASFSDGIVGNLMQRAAPVPGNLVEDGFTLAERRRRAPERNIVDNIIGATLRGSTPVLIGDPRFSNVRRYFMAAREEHNIAIKALERKLAENEMAANLTGDERFTREGERLTDRIRQLEEEFSVNWSTVLNAAEGSR